MADLIYIDVERLPTESERVTLTVFDLKEGKSQQTIYSGYSLQDCSKELADKIVSLVPVQVIFDEAGIGSPLKENVLNSLHDSGYEIADSGIVSIGEVQTKEKRKRKKVSEETN